MKKERIIINLLTFLLTFIIFTISASNIITVKAVCTVGVCDERNLDGPCCAKSGENGEPDINGYCARSTSGSGFKCIAYGGGDGGGGGGTGLGGGNGTAVNVKCDCTTEFGACGDKFGKTNIQWRECKQKAKGAETCKVRVGLKLYQTQACDAGTTGTPTPTETVPAPTDNLNCKCNALENCKTACTFKKFSDVTTYSDPIKCGLADIVFQTAPTADNKTSWCRAEKRTKGDANLDNNVTVLDYYYFVLANSGAKIPASINPDFNGDNVVDTKDRDIIVKSLIP